MRVPDEKTKGFNILELIVVLLIIGIVSALGYPEITKWRKDREVKSFAIATKTLIEGIVAQVQRGQYAFVQVRVDEEQVDVEGSNDRVLTITSKGMKPETLTNFLNDPASAWRTNAAGRCDIEDPDYWDADGGTDDLIEVRSIEATNLGTTFRGSGNTAATGAICFGKNDQWFSGAGQLATGGVPDSALFICEISDSRNICQVDAAGNPLTTEEGTEHKYLYSVEWSRFGNIVLERWNRNAAGWVNQ